jgi:alpha-glucosidase
MWNTDNYLYAKDEGKRLYQSHPWVMGVRKNGTAFDVLIDNTWKLKIELSNPITVVQDGPASRVIIVERDNPSDLVKAFAKLKGTIDMPPLWALGYQQCH